MSQLIGNAFSLNMVDEKLITRIRFKPLEVTQHPGGAVLSTADGKKFYPERMESIVGHEGTARLISSILGLDIAFNRASVILNEEIDELVVCQYLGPRLEEGCTELPENAVLNFVLMYFE